MSLFGRDIQHPASTASSVVASILQGGGSIVDLAVYPNGTGPWILQLTPTITTKPMAKSCKAEVSGIVEYAATLSTKNLRLTGGRSKNDTFIKPISDTAPKKRPAPINAKMEVEVKEPLISVKMKSTFDPKVTRYSSAQSLLLLCQVQPGRRKPPVRKTSLSA